MLTPGQTLSLTIEKPAVGGRMIARADGQVVLVAGAIPGERVSARIERVGKALAYAETLGAEQPSADRRVPFSDPLCGGCLYAHIAYPRQLEIKSLVIADAFSRIARVTLPAPVAVAPSPPEGYRMRARLHLRGTRLGFFREGTHEVCEARATRQLLTATCDVLDGLSAALGRHHTDTVREVEVSENMSASDRVVHLEASPCVDVRSLELLAATNGVTGLTVAGPTFGGVRVLAGTAYVSDVIALGDQPPLTIRRHVLAFFQGNRYLLPDLAAHVIEHVPPGSAMIDLYAGAGLLAVAAARVRGAHVTAVEGDRIAAEDLEANATAAGGAVTPVHQSVERFVGGRLPQQASASAKASADHHLHVETVIVDPPRTGMSREALDGVVGLSARRIVYVSCDVATLARDARRFLDAGYALARIDAFDLFPNTPHVETVVVFQSSIV